MGGWLCSCGWVGVIDGVIMRKWGSSEALKLPRQGMEKKKMMKMEEMVAVGLRGWPRSCRCWVGGARECGGAGKGAVGYEQDAVHGDHSLAKAVTAANLPSPAAAATTTANPGVRPRGAFPFPALAVKARAAADRRSRARAISAL